MRRSRFAYKQAVAPPRLNPPDWHQFLLAVPWFRVTSPPLSRIVWFACVKLRFLKKARPQKPFSCVVPARRGAHTIISFIDQRGEAEKITKLNYNIFGVRFFFISSHCLRKKKANQGVESSADGITTSAYFLWPWDRGNSTRASEIFEVVPTSLFTASFSR